MIKSFLIVSLFMKFLGIWTAMINLPTDPEEIYRIFSAPVQSMKITISFAGDCTLGTDVSFPFTSSFPDRFKKVNNDYGYFFKKVLPVFEKDDLTLVNLETTLTTATKRAVKTFTFKGPPSYVNILKAGSVEMVNISNNHIYDYLQQGFSDTLKTLQGADVAYSGEGHIAYHETKGIRIASIGYTGWRSSIKERIKEDIEKARKEADLVILSFHWGQERSFYPNQTQIDLGRFCIDQGADVVVGHHPHVVQGIERYKDKFIVYSLGNFCFGGNRNPSDKDTFIFQNTFELQKNGNKTSLGKIIPCSISSSSHVNDYQPTILSDKRKDRVLQRIYQYSSRLKYGIQRNDPDVSH